VYAGDDLLDLCDERGLLVWHDLPFACSKYPAENREFLAEVTREITWAARQSPRIRRWRSGAATTKMSGDTMPRPTLRRGLFGLRAISQSDPDDFARGGPRPSLPAQLALYQGRFLPNDPILGDQHPWA